MIKEHDYITIDELMSRLLRHPLLQDLNIEQVIDYTIDFINIFGLPKMYKDSQAEIHIDNYRGKLPCDCIQIVQVKDKQSGICLRSITDNFCPEEVITEYQNQQELAFKTQGQVIFTTMKSGDLIVAYKSIPVDKHGFPKISNNSVFLKALESYIKKEYFNILFDLGKLNINVLQKAEQNYCWLAGQLTSEFTIPSISEMESITRMWGRRIPKINEFNNGFNSLGNREYIKEH